MAIKLADVLSAVGYDSSLSDFCEVVQEQHALLHPAWSVDELLLNPVDCVKFCAHIRCITKTPSLADHHILRALLNRRKHELIGGETE